MKKYPPAPIPQAPLPLGTVVVTHLHEDGYYLILPGNTHIFQFVIPGGGYVKFEFTHTAANAQDFSIRGYFSQFPLSQSINTSSAAIRWFSFPRVQQTIILKDRLFPVPKKDNPNFLYPAGVYYLNVQNLLAWENGYHLLFQMHDHLKPHNHPIAGSHAPITPPLTFP